MMCQYHTKKRYTKDTHHIQIIVVSTIHIHIVCFTSTVDCRHNRGMVYWQERQEGSAAASTSLLLLLAKFCNDVSTHFRFIAKFLQLIQIVYIHTNLQYLETFSRSMQLQNVTYNTVNTVHTVQTELISKIHKVFSF